MLHRPYHGPPFAGLRVRGHFGHVGFKVIAGVLDEREEHPVFMNNGVIPDIAPADSFQHFGPHRGVQALILLQAPRLDPDDLSMTLHAVNFHA